MFKYSRLSFSLKKYCLPLSVVFMVINSQFLFALPAFPGAQGFGAENTHARGKSLCRVTRFDDEDKWQAIKFLKPGQFRYCLEKIKNSGGGYVIFDISGTIRLKRRAKIPSNIYIAGQTSTGGVAIEGNALIINAVSNVVIRHIRFRESAPKGDAISIVNSNNIVIDHVSISAFKDGAIDIVDNAKDITIQWSHMGDAMHSGAKHEPYHGEPNLLRTGVDRVSFHHNLYTHGHSRMPWVKSSCSSGMLIEFSNNVVYNFRKYPSVFDAPNGRGNVIGNYYIPGANTHGDLNIKKRRPSVIGSNNFSLYVRDNISADGVGHDAKKMEGPDQGVGRGPELPVYGSRPTADIPDNLIMGVGPGKLGPEAGVLNQLHKRVEDIPMITTQDSSANLTQVLAHFGAMPRDNTDKRLASEVDNRTGMWRLVRPSDNNLYVETVLELDQDNDGLPDEFERKHGKNLSTNGHDLHTDYENIEVYLNVLADKILAASN
jgi:pectate lyase